MQHTLTIEPATSLAIVASGTFLLAGLFTGIWKWRQMLGNEDHTAHIYVDLAHRASLLYSFAAMLLAVFAALSAWDETIDLVATAVPLFYFAMAIGTYVVLGIRRRTQNQFAQRNIVSTWGTGLLAVGEVGGVVVLFAGTLRTLLT